MAEQLQQTLAEGTQTRSRFAVLRGPGATRLWSLPPPFTRSVQFEAASQPTRGTGAPEAYRTPADYRTALLSDSPQGCPLSAEVQDSGERPGREAGVRYSARRAPRGRGRCPPLLFSARRWPWPASPRKSNERPFALGRLGARQSEGSISHRIDTLDRAYPARRRQRPPPPNNSILKPQNTHSQNNTKKIYQNYLQSRPESAGSNKK